MIPYCPSARNLVLLLALVVNAAIPQADAWWLESYWPSFLGIKSPFSNVPQCYGDLGCFRRFPPSKDFLPDIPGLYPATPEEISVKFYVYSCQSRFRPYIVDWNASDEHVAKSPYNPKLRTIFIVHGFRDSFDEMDWMGDLKDFILETQSRLVADHNKCQYNVVAVDWRNGSQITFYPQAVANTMMVGAQVARFIKQLIRMYQNTEDDFTVTGHSLGAHVSGFVGKSFVQNKLRNIIGYDPAGPMFTDTPNSHRLSPSDAKLVLTIHTNGGLKVGDTFGTLIPLGHYSFFPNGGTEQPGCDKTQAISKILVEGLATGLTDTLACAHRRATRLVQFNPILLTDAESVAYKCVNYEDYKAGKCGECSDEEQCKPFSSWFFWWQTQKPAANWTAPISYYLDTMSTIPWALFEFQVVIETGSFVPVRGTFGIQPIGSLRNRDPFEINPGGLIEPNSLYSHVIKVPKSIGKVTKAYVTLQGENNGTVVINSVKFNYLSNQNATERRSLSTTLVGVRTNSLNAGERALFTEEFKYYI